MKTRFLLAFGFLLLASACSVQQTEPQHAFEQEARWVVLPFENHSETPMASERVEALTLAALRTHRFDADTTPSNAENPDFLQSNRSARFNDALAHARALGFKYGVTGSVVEWRYKSGLDGEPAVGIALRVIDVPTGRMLWSGSHSRSGWSRESLAGTGQKVLDNLVGGLMRG